MFDEIGKKIRGVAINAALKVMSKKDRLSWLFFTTPASSINPIVLLPASHSVGKAIHDRMKNVGKHGLIYSGSLAGVKVTLIRTNVGGPGVANVMEVLKEVQPRAVIRVDYAGSIVDSMNVGDVFVADAAIPGDGTSIQYINAHLPRIQQRLERQASNDTIHCTDPVYSWLSNKRMTGTVACDERLLGACMDAAKARGIPVTTGTTWTTDGLFTESKEKVDYWRQLGAKGVDMETSVLYLLAFLYGIPALAIHAISDNLNLQKPFYELDSFDSRLEDGLKAAISVAEQMTGIL